MLVLILPVLYSLCDTFGVLADRACPLVAPGIKQLVLLAVRNLVILTIVYFSYDFHRELKCQVSGLSMCLVYLLGKAVCSSIAEFLIFYTLRKGYSPVQIFGLAGFTPMLTTVIMILFFRQQVTFKLFVGISFGLVGSILVLQ